MTLTGSRELTETGPQCKVNVSTASGAKEQKIQQDFSGLQDINSDIINQRWIKRFPTCRIVLVFPLNEFINFL